MTPEEIGAAIRAFRSDNCPACDTAKKRKEDPFCGHCFDRLPADLQEDVSDHGLFLDAFHPALSYLNASSEPSVPQPRENGDED